MGQDNQIIKSIDFGFEVEAFLQSNIGKYLIGRAEEEVEAAVESLKSVDPENPKEIRGLQHKISVAENIQYWLADAIQAGHNAQEQLQERGN